MALFKKDQKEINLVPEAEKKVKGSHAVFATAAVVGSLTLLVLVVSTAIFLLNLNESRKVNNLEKDLDKELAIWQGLAPIAQKSTSLKAKSVQIKDLQTSNENFRLAFAEVKKFVPNGVKLEALTVSSSNAVTLQASAAHTAELYQFADTLEEQAQLFESVEIVTLVKNDENFVLNLDLKSKAK